MSPLVFIRLSLRALLANKLRSGLAMLGVIIGVTAVICIVSLGESANQMVQEQIASLGANRLVVAAGSSRAGGFHGGQGSVTTLTMEDFEALLRECPSIEAATPTVRAGVVVVRGNQNWSTNLQGTNELLPKLRDWPVESGRFFSTADARTGTKVCVLGKTVATNLFGDASPIGQSVRIRQFPFTVIGVLSAKGQAAWGNDFDDTVLAPFRTVQKRLLAIDHIQQIQVMARSAADTDAAQEEITAVLRRRHRIQEGADDDFMVRNQKEMADAAASTGNVLTMLLAAVAGVSLLVGGIGVMNIMLVSVSERTREIGIRMAVGARGRDILSQFLAEAVCLTGTGGVLGILLAWVAAVGFKQFLPWPMRIAPWAAAVSFLFSAAIGIAFGLYPAWRAAKMDPVDALRTT